MKPRLIHGATLLVLLVPAFLGATEPNRKQADVLDFDADIIEGQKKAPDIFLQTDVQKPSIDTVLYQRRDFNDYHAVDSRLRPRLADSPTTGGSAGGQSRKK